MTLYISIYFIEMIIINILSLFNSSEIMSLYRFFFKMLFVKYKFIWYNEYLILITKLIAAAADIVLLKLVSATLCNLLLARTHRVCCYHLLFISQGLEQAYYTLYWICICIETISLVCLCRPLFLGFLKCPNAITQLYLSYIQHSNQKSQRLVCSHMIWLTNSLPLSECRVRDAPMVTNISFKW